ncbi:MAG: nucleoside hydrolase [Flavobacteriaceae bacterium]|nr:nucleoside hydrolase [Flavobacteriaceae bacterium]
MKKYLLLLLVISFKWSISQERKIPIILDTDANNELDDQHALAYLFFNEETFDIKGITVNTTYNGGEIDQHYDEANRVADLCDVSGKYLILKGANSNFDELKAQVQSENFDGKTAVDFIIKEAHKSKKEKLVIAAIGKLTNVALAVEKDPSIKNQIRLVWLGSNYPEPGEYNQENDIPSLNYLLEQDLDFEIVTVRYGKKSGSDAVKVSLDEVQKKMKDKGPEVKPVIGRHGGSFTNFGDYSIELFSKIDLYGNPPSRALFDLVALAVLKNSQWGKKRSIPTPTVVAKKWVDRPQNQNRITLWENFDRKAIINDFYDSLNQH